MLVAEAVARAVAQEEIEAAFGVAGSGNFRLVNALRSAGVQYHAACHEAGAVAMADGYARASGRVGVATVHQGPGLTNTLTALTEAVRSQTPLVILAAENRASRASAQALDQSPVVRSLGARAARLEDPAAAASTVAKTLHRAVVKRRPIVLMLPVDLLERSAPGDVPQAPAAPAVTPAAASEEAVAELAKAIVNSQRPLIVAGRGAVVAEAGPALRRLAASTGALLTTTIVAKGLFAGDPFDAGFIGGLGSPPTTELAQQADLVLAFGTSLDDWTTCGGRILNREAQVAAVDDDPVALANNHRATLAIAGDAALTAEALADLFADRAPAATWRQPELAARIARYRRADEIPNTSSGLLDPRRLAVELNRRLPPNRIVSVDSGHFLAFPSIYIGSPDGRSFLFAQGFQSVGLGLGVGIGAAVAQRDKIVTAVIGDGGAKMSLLEIDTAVRYSLPVAVVIFDDGGYGAEIHDFEAVGEPVDIARFPSRDYAAIGRALGAEGVTVNSLQDLEALNTWQEVPAGPIVLDCKVDPNVDAVSVMTKAGAAEWSMSAHGDNRTLDTTEERCQSMPMPTSSRKVSWLGLSAS